MICIGEYLDSFEGLFEGEGHATTDDEGVDFSDKIINQLNLIRNFCPTENGQEWSFRFLECFSKVFKFLLHKEPRSPLREINPDHRRMSTMCGSKGIVYN